MTPRVLISYIIVNNFVPYAKMCFPYTSSHVSSGEKSHLVPLAKFFARQRLLTHVQKWCENKRYQP